MRLIPYSVLVLSSQLTESNGVNFRGEMSRREDPRCSSAYVAVFSRRDQPGRRKHIRKMWQDAGAGWGDVMSQFVFCLPLPDEPPHVAKELAAEAKQYNDILVMDCEDGYLNGALTKKVEASMQFFLQEHSDRKFFMKTDDDTFARMSSICGLLSWREKHNRTNDNLYLGVFAEGAETMETKHPPCRDEKSEWYEPVEKFAGQFYPKSAKGGPGYILSSDLVTQIIQEGIAAANILNNEDKAVGVWVDELVKRNVSVSMLNIPGTDGYDEHKKWTVTTGQYGDYPFFLHHHLVGKTIECLHDIQVKQDASEYIDDCFMFQD